MLPIAVPETKTEPRQDRASQRHNAVDGDLPTPKRSNPAEPGDHMVIHRILPCISACEHRNHHWEI